MNSFSLPPTPNWYDNGVAACAPDNTYLYASLGDLVVIQPNSSPNMKVVYKIHKDRVTSINVNPEWGNPDKLVVTTGKDKNVKVYDVNSWRAKASHAGHTTRNEKVVGATFCGSDRIISVSESGFIILWKITSDDLTSIQDVLTLKDKVTALSACPHQYGMVAFGYSRGTILITDLRNRGRVMYRLMKHESPIVDLAWCPAQYNIFPNKVPHSASEKENRKPLQIKVDLANKVKEIDELNNPDIVQTETENEIVITETQQLENSESLEPAKEFLLASSALGDSKIVIWRAYSNGTMQIELRLAKQFNNKKYRFKSDKDNTWISLAWVAPTTLLSSSSKSELLQWNLTTGFSTGVYKSIMVHNEHKQFVFSIKAPLKLFKTSSPTTWRETSLPAVWTLSKDRLIINSALSPSCEISFAYPTIAGQVNVLSTSKINPARLAISTSEDTCRLIDLSNSDTKIILMNSFEKMPHKISAMTWHPRNENLLTFGTFDGQVGAVDACQLFKPCNFYVQYRNAPIIAMDWGPTPENSDTLGLYVVVFGELVMFDSSKPFAYPKVLLDGKSWVSFVAWKPDYEVCAVGNKFGHVSFFNKKFECLTTTYIQSKQIRALAWHPHVTGEDLELSPCNHWLAACANDVVVYDLEEVNFGEKIEDREKQVKVLAKFASNAKHMMGIDWSPHENGKLVAITDVSFITVWNVKSKEVVASIKAEQFSTFLCVIWSPVHENFIISGGKGNTLRYWKVSENLSNVMGMKILPPKSKNGTNGYHEEVTNGDSDSETINKLIDAKTVKQNPKCILALSAQSHNSSDIIGMTKVCEKLFYMQESSASPTPSDEQSCSVDITKLFGTREDIEDILKMEVDFHSKRKYNYALNHISLWEGSIEDQITKAINTDTVTLWHVNMAPIVSHQFWRNTCEAYARQLAEEGPNSAFEASTYFLACNKITQAIEVLCEHNKHREALTLAKLRLVPEDSRITEIYKKYAKFSEDCGNYEVAAQCYIALGSPSDAVKALIRRTNAVQESLEFCLRLAKQAGEEEIYNAVCIRLEEIAVKNAETNELKPLLKRVDLELALHEKEIELQTTNGNVDSEKEEEIVTAYNHRSTNIQDTLKQRLDQIDLQENNTDETTGVVGETKIEVEASNSQQENDIKITDKELEKEQPVCCKESETKIEEEDESKIEEESDSRKEDESKINEESNSSKEAETKKKDEESDSLKEDETKIKEEESDSLKEDKTKMKEEKSDSPKEDETKIKVEELDSPKEDETKIKEEESDPRTEDEKKIKEEQSDPRTEDETKITEEESDPHMEDETKIKVEELDSLKEDETKIEKVKEEGAIETEAVEIDDAQHVDAENTQKTDESKVEDACHSLSISITDCDASAKQEIGKDAV